MILLALIASLNAPAADWKKATVKIRSFPCLTESPMLEGSGLALNIDGKSYVVTSEHVVIHSNAREICHEANGRKVELERADFAAGMALLKSPDALDEAVDVTALESRRLVGDLKALGYPAGADQLSVLTGGKLLTSSSRRALIAGQPELIEASGLPVEFGMSGGILTAGEEFAGLLSHQVLKREAGKATRPGDIQPGPGNGNDLLLAIPPAAVGQFALSLLDPSSGWTRESAAQIRGEPALRKGPLVFSLQKGKAGDVWDIGGVDFGGSDGSGIGGDDGGSDGSGIGGDEGAGEEIGYIELAFAKDISPGDKARKLDDSRLDQWREWLLRGHKVRIVFLKNPLAKRLTRIQSLSQFLTFWQRDDFQPLAIRSRNGNEKDNAEILIQRARTMEALAQGARDAATKPEFKAWFAMIRDHGVMAENLLISSKEMLGLVEGEKNQNNRYWLEFYDQDWDRAVALESSIQALVEQMKRMGL